MKMIMMIMIMIMMIMMIMIMIMIMPRAGREYSGKIIIWTIIDDDKVGDFASRGQGGNIM